MKLFVGLGNPGPEHARQRHNIGFMAMAAIASEHGAPAWRKKYRGLLTDVVLAGERVYLLCPLTYMNESGRSVAEAARFHKFALDDIIVFHDELDLAPGKVRVKTGGGVAGHNGLRSIKACIGDAGFVRVRLGIGHPGSKAKVLRHVLGDFAKTEQPMLEDLLAALAKEAPRLAENDAAHFMNKVSTAMAPHEPAKKPKPPKAAKPKKVEAEAQADEPSAPEN